MRYLFENYVLDEPRRELRRDGEVVQLGPQTFDILVCLIRNRERVVSHDDLRVAVWDGRIISVSTLNSSINAARVAVGDNGADQRLIRTLPRKGFRFVGQIVEENATPGPTAAPVASADETPQTAPPDPSASIEPTKSSPGQELQIARADLASHQDSDNGENQRLIRTLPRENDRFVCPEREERESVEPIAPSPPDGLTAGESLPSNESSISTESLISSNDSLTPNTVDSSGSGSSAANDAPDHPGSHAPPAVAPETAPETLDQALDPTETSSDLSPSAARERAPSRTKRKIAAIFASDIAQYSRLIAEDEEETVRRLTSLRKGMEVFITRDSGRVFSIAGDAVYAEFPSAVDAVRCAIDIQESMRTRNLAYPPNRHMNLRIGITIGDVVEQDGALIGDGVNIAARLEGIAEVGGICVSRAVYEQVANKLSVRFADIGEQQVKNIPTPVHAFRVQIRPIEIVPPPGKASLAQESRTLSPRLALIAAWASYLVSYVAVPALLIVLAHYLIVMKLNLDPIYLRIVAFVVPLLVGYLLASLAEQGPGIAFGLGASVALIAVLSMLVIVAVVDGRPILPGTLFEWQETAEYWVTITLSMVLGNVLLRARSLVRLVRTKSLR